MAFYIAGSSCWKPLKKWGLLIPYDPAIPVLGIYPEKTIIQKDICTPDVLSSTIHNSQDREAT